VMITIRRKGRTYFDL